MHLASWEDVAPPCGLGGWSWGSARGEVTLPAYPGIKRLSPSDLGTIVETADRLGIEPDWLATIMQFESGVSTTQPNAAGSGATGLIQFMPDTAQKLLGTATPAEAIAQLKAMSFPEQMKVVERYFAPHAGTMKSLSDAYLAVLYPALIGASDRAVMARSGTATYEQNAGFDHAHKGYITKADITGQINALADSMKERVATGIALGITPIRLPTVLTAVAIVAAAGAAAWSLVYWSGQPIARRRPEPAPV